MTYTKRPKQFLAEKRTRVHANCTFITYVKSRSNRRKKHVMRRSRQRQERDALWTQEIARHAADRIAERLQ